jgi:hypothetical protein
MPSPSSDILLDRLESSLDEFIRETRRRDRTWERVLRHLRVAANGSLVVDRIAVERSGVDWDSLADLRFDSAANALFDLGQVARLNLIRAPRGLLLTSTVEAARIAWRRIVVWQAP